IETQALVLGEQNRRQCDGSLLQQVHQSSVRRPFSFHVHPPHPYYTSAKEEKTVLKNKKHRSHADAEIDDKPPGSFRKKSARGCMFMGNKQITEIRFGKLGGSQSLFLSSRGARPFF